jgi:hypothetical protein
MEIERPVTPIRRTMKTKKIAALFTLVLVTAAMPARAWVAVGGYRGGVAVGYRPPCCYGGAAVAGAAVAGAMVGAAVATSAAPVYTAAPVYYAAPVAYAPPIGTVVASIPPNCSSMSVNGVSYMNCSGIFYMPFYSGGALMYRVSQP